jgi:hypothetical protein
MRVSVIAAVMVLAACRGGPGDDEASNGPPPEVVKALQIPPSPYYIIYSPPVDLAKKKA